ncbi:hypothetical protein AGIG_G5996 [Arapaima gigas]
MWALRPGPPEILGFTPLCHTAKFTCLGVIPSVTCCLSSKNLQTQADSSVSFPSQSLMGSKIPQIPRVQLLCGFKVKQLFQGPLADSSDPGCVAKTTYGCPMEHQDTGNLRNFCTDERGRRSSPSWSVWLLSEEPSAAGAPRHTAGPLRPIWILDFARQLSSVRAEPPWVLLHSYRICRGLQPPPSPLILN